MDHEEYYRLSNCQDEWFCNTCILPNFTDSFFSNRDLTNHSILDSDQSVLELSYSHIDNQDKQNSINCEPNLKDVTNQNKTNCILGYLNINSFKHKYESFKDILLPCNLDIVCIAETKIDSSFPDAQFNLSNYRMFRSDNSDKSGGLLAYVLSNIHCRTLNNYKLVYTESIILEVLLRDKKWIVVYTGSYKNPSVTNANFTEDFTHLLDRLLMDYSNVIVMGD